MFKATFEVLPFAFCLGAMALFVRPARVGVRAQALWAAALAACASKFLCFEALGGDAFAPELPEALIWTWGWAYSGMCILFALAAAWQTLRLLSLRRLPKGRGLAWLVGLPLVAWTLAAAGVWNGLKAPRVVEVELSVAGLPESLDGYRILQISDIHVSAAATRRRTEAVVRLANAAAPDLVCLTGDYADGMPAAQAANVAPLKELRARDGIYAVTGNHEFYFDYRGWMDVFDGLGVRFLVNECAFPRPGLAVGGVEDPVGMQMLRPAPDTAAAFAAATNGEFRVLLQHRPWIDFEALGLPPDETPRDLQLSGHTHGGIAPGFASLIAQFNMGFVSGMYESAGPARRLYVSRGAGQWAGFPVRFFNDPEIAVFTLRRRQARTAGARPPE